MSLWFKNLPASWEEAPLKYRLARNDGGVWGEDPEGSDADTVVLRSTEQRVDGAWNIEAPALRKLSSAEAESTRLKVGDLVVTKSSGSDLHIGKTSLVTPEVAALRACYSNFMQRLRVDARTDPRFVHYWMNNELCREQFAYLSNSTSGLANLNGTVLGTARLAFPSMQEQGRIANFLDAQTARIDALISEKHRLVELLHVARESHITKLVTEGLGTRQGLSAATVPYSELQPSHWRVVRLDRLFSIRNEAADGSEPLLTAFIDGVVTLRENRPEATIKSSGKELGYQRAYSGDLVISGMNAHLGGLGISDSYGKCTPVYIVMKPLVGVSKTYFSYLLRHMAKSGYIGSLTNTIRYNSSDFKKDDVKLMQVLLPPITEQEQIASSVEQQVARFDELSRHAEMHAARLREYRSSLISAVVTGQLDISSFKAKLPEAA